MSATPDLPQIPNPRSQIPRLGILGGGQLGRMMLQAASRLGLEVVIAERFADSPAARLTSRSVVFENGWGDQAALEALASQACLVTLENEFVDWRILKSLQDRGLLVRPSPDCVRLVQDKLLQKQALARAELPVPPFREITDSQSLRAAGDDLGWPLMLKARRDGYDGHGNALVRSAAETDAALNRLGWPQRRVYAEAWVAFECELATLVVRGTDANVRVYPVVETRQDPRLHICKEVVAPAAVPQIVAERAQTIARAAVEAVHGVGAFGVELFLLTSDQLLVNELAPRPHNSAHYTIEACWTSQFENHVRAVMGWPLGDSGLRAPAAAMVNLLGSRFEPVEAGAALAEPRAYIHLYGKTDNRPGRKMGHITAVAATVEQALALAQRAASRISV